MIKIFLVAFVSAFLILTLKALNSDFYQTAIICTGIILSVMITEYLSQTFNLISKLTTLSGISPTIFKIVIKAVGIGYLSEFSASTLEDFGLNSISKKVLLAGKIIIIVISIPIIETMITIIEKFVNL
ncbi:MAG: stage III sporulation protein AD [Clostridia bacterium]|nr:stage III sporulation protein AD [Clostridia bacterium]